MNSCQQGQMRVKMKLILITILCCLLPVSVVISTRQTHHYCRLPYCKAKNLACKNKGGLSRNCYPQAKLVSITHYRLVILKAFNIQRNKVAGGEYRHLPQAARMAKMDWSTELENFAKLDVSRCVTAPKICMSSSHFYYIGRLADRFSYSGSLNNHQNYHVILKMINNWGQYVLNLRRTDTLYLPRTLPTKDLYNSALMLTERNTHVGCALLRYSFDQIHNVLFSCAFSTDNLEGQRIYQWASTAGSRCHKRDTVYKNLCAYGEAYDNSRPMSNITIFTTSLGGEYA